MTHIIWVITYECNIPVANKVRMNHMIWRHHDVKIFETWLCMFKTKISSFFSNFRILAPLCRHYKLINSVWVTSSGVSAPLEWNKWWFSNFGFRFFEILANIWIKKCHRIFMNFSNLRIKCQNRGFQDIRIDEFYSIVKSSVLQFRCFEFEQKGPVRSLHKPDRRWTYKKGPNSRLLKSQFALISKMPILQKNIILSILSIFWNFFLTKNLT